MGQLKILANLRRHYVAVRRLMLPRIAFIFVL